MLNTFLTFTCAGFSAAYLAAGRLGLAISFGVLSLVNLVCAYLNKSVD